MEPFGDDKLFDETPCIGDILNYLPPQYHLPPQEPQTRRADDAKYAQNATKPHLKWLKLTLSLGLFHIHLSQLC